TVARLLSASLPTIAPGMRHLSILDVCPSAPRMSQNVVGGVVGPAQLLPADSTGLLLVRVPDDPSLLGCEDAPVVLVVEQGEKQTRQEFAATLPVGGTVRVAPDGQ